MMISSPEDLEERNMAEGIPKSPQHLTSSGEAMLRHKSEE
jgi:hypothetical protein